ncbi:RSC complex protein [Mycena kentingensis (nom. inval.)]|nr:RSC complex protein [Mycena kentingensis (nom. inval.)]
MKRAHRHSMGDDGREAKRLNMGEPGSEDDFDDDVVPGDAGPSTLASSSYAVNIRAQGLALWNKVRVAKNKEGYELAGDFLRKPSKKLYPDYYIFIQHPIALEDIKKQLETDYYPTLEAVRQDFELCFENAMRYNMEGSAIWQVAKDLLKVTNKAYNKMVPSVDEGNPTGKQPSLHRLARSRLKKLIEKADSSGRLLSTIFMDLPSKKDWPQYYVQIQEPRCLKAIHKKLKNKAYTTMTEFADEVELVFANAMVFNMEHTQIWDDAFELKSEFGKLMSDLPAPFAMDRYKKTTGTKIKLKLPAAAASAPAITEPPVASSSSVKLKVPDVKAKGTPSPAVAPVALPPAKPAKPDTNVLPKMTATAAPKASTSASSSLLNQLPSTNSIKPSRPQTKRQVAPIPPPAPVPPPVLPPAQLQPQMSYTNAPLMHYPMQNGLRQPQQMPPSYLPAPPPQVPLPQPPPHVVALPTPAANPAPLKSESPAPPPILPSHMLRGVSVMAEPSKRPFKLDHRDGVKTWVIRLGAGETALSVADVAFMGDDEESSDEEAMDEDVHEDEDEMEGVEAGKAVNGTAKKANTRGRQGKSRAQAAQAAAAAKALEDARAAKRAAKEIGEVQVKLNGLVISEKAGSWRVEIPKGSNVVEIGEKDGLVWKVYAQKAGF